MKKLLPYFFSFSIVSAANAQITTPVIKAAFGVDGDLRANFYNNFATSGNDDWFTTGGTGGTAIIDTTGAAAIIAGYLSDVSPYPRRMNSFYRSMRVAPYSVVNNRLWLDAMFVRDYHGTDTTVFVQGTSKNGLSPEEWGGTIQSVPDKNEILDMMMHLRRAGDGRDPNRVDSLWLFGAVSMESTSGNRYFDFELYQTDIYYDRASRKFYGYGPDAGHTSWKFDAAGNILQAGDVIFSASYQSSSLTNIEARLWIDRASLSITPAGFSWTGVFDGASNGAQFGYAAIVPKTSGSFYTGLENNRAAWAGPFRLVRADNSIVNDYLTGQFMEFSVNLTKLGIDPANLLGGDLCGSPFNRMIVKTRSSDAFTSSLKDFVAPLDLFLSPRVNATTEAPFYCGSVGISELKVVNPSPSSVYTWTTLDGHFVGAATGPSVVANAPGTYVVMQQLAEGCNPYAYDTLTIVYDQQCRTLDAKAVDFQAVLKREVPQLSWTSYINNTVTKYEVEVSYDGSTFASLKKIDNRDIRANVQGYTYEDRPLKREIIYYRLKMMTTSGVAYSQVARLLSKAKISVLFAPNPASHKLTVSFTAEQSQGVQLTLFNLNGKVMYERSFAAAKGNNSFIIDALQQWPDGLYMAQIRSGKTLQWQRILVQKAK